jgi:hypothetical protein
LQDVLALPEAERLELASEIIASVDGPRDTDWETVWLNELDRGRRCEGSRRDGFRVDRRACSHPEAARPRLKTLRVLPEAEEELAQAAEWYEAKRIGLWARSWSRSRIAHSTRFRMPSLVRALAHRSALPTRARQRDAL